MVIEDLTYAQALQAVQGGDHSTIIEQALKALKARNSQYIKYERYYCGVHPLNYQSEQYKDNFSRMVDEYAENLCPAVVDSITDRLVVTGFTQEGEDDGGPISRAAWDIWRQNRMDEVANGVHTEAVKAGDAYIVVWPDVLDQTVRLWPQDANGMTVYYNEATDQVEWAAKWWIGDDKFGYLTLYLRDSVEKYKTNNKVDSTGFISKAVGLTLFESVPHPYEQVPVFHFANNARINHWGNSELRDVVPIQDALNKVVCDMLVDSEYGAFPQRWATGLSIKVDPATGKPAEGQFKASRDHLWTTASKDANFGQFEVANLDQMLNVQNRFKEAIADVAGIPTHYLRMASTGEWPSGESLKTAEARFVSKIRKRQVSFGNVWEDIMIFALKLQGKAMTGRLNTVWTQASPRSEVEAASVSVIKGQLGIPNSQLQKELGYSDEEIQRFASEKEKEAEAAMERQQRLFDQGGIPDEG